MAGFWKEWARLLKKPFTLLDGVSEVAKPLFRLLPPALLAGLVVSAALLFPWWSYVIPLTVLVSVWLAATWGIAWERARRLRLRVSGLKLDDRSAPPVFFVTLENETRSVPLKPLVTITAINDIHGNGRFSPPCVCLWRGASPATYGLELPEGGRCEAELLRVLKYPGSENPSLQ